ncbi:homoserine O-succinyltransferase [Cocleimonas flava]|uniref:Homoserine O-succinyltransferase n=1 Tax=Cocleimonas flava TaxID=634765 RepID=A0A4R1F2L2_9GAMM|nr:homoserine O-succinyltransferase [Cocleimonas flava]TCJ87680.1 homoserine O-succinyltransferase [Cocleimonas flava]
MPLVEHSKLPTFQRLRDEGQVVLRPGQASKQDIRALHIGILNMMPDTAMQATERQFYRLIGESNPIAQFHVHPFSLPVFERGKKAQKHIDKYYNTFEEIKEAGIDALIITGANVSQPKLPLEPFWEPLSEVFQWAHENVTSTLCSCLATHAALELQYNQARYGLGYKRWGVFSHRVTDKNHPLVKGINTRFDVPHSRFNQIDRSQFEAAGLHVLAESKEAGVQMAVSPDGFRTVYFQGHPEYDSISLLKEYKREVGRFAEAMRAGEQLDYPPFPLNVFDIHTQAILNEFRYRLIESINNNKELPAFPEALILDHIDNSWHDTAAAILANWMGLVYQVTNVDRRLPFMDSIDPDNPLSLKNISDTK